MPEARDASTMRIRTVVLVLLLGLSTVAGSAVAPAAAQTGTVTLTVSVQTPDGDPVADAELTATWEGGSATRTTASNGKAFIDVPSGADVTIEVDHPDYVRNSPFQLTNAEEEEVTITVYDRARATLTIVDSDGPVNDARVEFRRHGEVAVTRFTDPDGEVESGIIEAGNYTVTLFKAGYLRQSVELDIQGTSFSDQLQIERGSVSVTFVVLDSNFEPPRPVAEAEITGPDFTSQTQADGSRTVSLPVNTQQRITVEKEGYDTVEQVVIVREQDKRVNITTRKLPAINVEVPNRRVVVGEALQVTVTDQYGEPLREAVVYLDGESVGQPNAQGVIRVPIESAGDHTLVAELDQLSSEPLTITGVEAGSGPVTTTDQPTPDDDDDAGSVNIPGVGPVNMRSLGVGIAGGLVLAIVLFIWGRIR